MINMKFGIIGGGFGYDCHFSALSNIKDRIVNDMNADKKQKKQLTLK